jgi:predicted metal-dependent enzyme (double-stranded beta helix superfamily)
MEGIIAVLRGFKAGIIYSLMGKYPDACPKDHFVAAGMIYLSVELMTKKFSRLRSKNNAGRIS